MRDSVPNYALQRNGTAVLRAAAKRPQGLLSLRAFKRRSHRYGGRP